MLTFNNLHTLYTTITKDSTAANLAQGKLLINDTQKQICAMGDWTFLDDEWTCSSVASQEYYRLPHNYGRLISVYVLDGSTRCVPVEVPSAEEFDKLASVNSTSGYPQYFNIYGDYIRFYPFAPDTSWTIHLKYKKQPIDMSADDYSTGNIGITINTTGVTGNGTTFTAAMIGRYLKTTDGLWYPISAFTNGTTIALGKTYEGATITGATYTIGEIPIIPDGFQEMLIYPALEHYFMLKGEEGRSSFYQKLYERDLLMLKSRYQTRTTNQVIRRSDRFRDPNDYPQGLHE